MLDTNNPIELDNTIIIDDSEIAAEIKDLAKIPLAAFVQDFGAGILQAVRQQNPPCYNGNANPARAAILNELKRQPFIAQQRVIQAITHLLIDRNERAAIINAEMGTGKTLMGIATAAICNVSHYLTTSVP